MKEAKKANYKFESKVLDINNLDVSILLYHCKFTLYKYVNRSPL